MEKDWKKIADVIDKPLRQVLISSKGLIASGLAKGFPEYFISDNGQQKPLTRQEALQIAKDAQEIGVIDGLVEMLKQMAITYIRRDFMGSCNSFRPSAISKSVGSMLICEGDYYINLFCRSSQEHGEKLEYAGTTWLVLWNSYDPGDGDRFARHSLVIVPIDALPVPSWL